MKTIAEIVELSEEKLRTAEFLALHGFCDDAYYLGGYVFELHLKAKICKNLGIPDFFDFENSNNRKLGGQAKRTNRENLYRSFKVHDYEQLLILAGLFANFSDEIKKNKEFGENWSIISH